MTAHWFLLPNIRDPSGVFVRHAVLFHVPHLAVSDSAICCRCAKYHHTIKRQWVGVREGLWGGGGGGDGRCGDWYDHIIGICIVCPIFKSKWKEVHWSKSSLNCKHDLDLQLSHRLASHRSFRRLWHSFSQNTFETLLDRSFDMKLHGLHLR